MPTRAPAVRTQSAIGVDASVAMTTSMMRRPKRGPISSLVLTLVLSALLCALSAALVLQESADDRAESMVRAVPHHRPSGHPVQAVVGAHRSSPYTCM